MNTKLILIAMLLGNLAAKANSSVDNSASSVDNEYKHQVTCNVSTESGDYIFQVDWNKAEDKPEDKPEDFLTGQTAFEYRLTELKSDAIYSGKYSTGFDRFVAVEKTDSQLSFSGQFAMYKRLGYLENDVHFSFDAGPGGELSLANFSEQKIETFENPDHFCHPRAMPCGYDPLPEPKNVITLVIQSSTCQILK